MTLKKMGIFFFALFIIFLLLAALGRVAAHRLSLVAACWDCSLTVQRLLIEVASPVVEYRLSSCGV